MTENMVSDQKQTFLNKHMSTFWKMFRARKTHEWYLGLPIHVKLIFIMLNILIISTIVINSYTLLVLIYSLLAIPYSLLVIAY